MHLFLDFHAVTQVLLSSQIWWWCYILKSRWITELICSIWFVFPCSIDAPLSASSSPKEPEVIRIIQRKKIQLKTFKNYSFFLYILYTLCMQNLTYIPRIEVIKVLSIQTLSQLKFWSVHFVFCGIPFKNHKSYLKETDTVWKRTKLASSQFKIVLAFVQDKYFVVVNQHMLSYNIQPW